MRRHFGPCNPLPHCFTVLAIIFRPAVAMIASGDAAFDQKAFFLLGPMQPSPAGWSNTHTHTSPAIDPLDVPQRTPGRTASAPPPFLGLTSTKTPEMPMRPARFTEGLGAAH